MQQGGKEVGEIIVQVAHNVEVLVDAALDKQGDAASSGNGESASDNLPKDGPHVKQWREGDEIHQDGQEGADMEDDAHGVGRQVHVRRFLILGHHGSGVGVNHAFGNAARWFRQIFGFAKADNADKMIKQHAETYR